MKPKQLLQNFQTEEPKDETMQKAEKATETLSFGPGRFAKKSNDGKFYAYGGNAPDVELDPAELAKAQEAKEKKPAEPDRIEQLKREHIAESKKAQGREVPFRAAPKMKQGSPREVIAELGKEEAPLPEEELGASKGTASFVRSTAQPQDKFRIRYGYINEDNLGDFSNSQVEDAEDYDKALERYKSLGWLKDYDDKGRRFARIEKSSDNGKTYETNLFHEAQHRVEPRKEPQEPKMKQGSPREVINSLGEEEPGKATQEFTDDRLAEEIMDNEYIYNGISRERAAEIMSKRLGVSYDRAKKFLNDTGFDPNYGEEPESPDLAKKAEEKPADLVKKPEATQEKAPKYSNVDPDVLKRMRREEMKYLDPRSARELAVMSDDEFLDYLKYTYDHTAPGGFDKMAEHQKLFYKQEEPDNLQALREKHKKSIIKPSEVAPFWAYVNPRTKYASRFKTEEEALKYAESVEENDQKFAAQQAEMLIKDFQEGKVDKKGLAQFGKNQYAPEILSYLLSKIK